MSRATALDHVGVVGRDVTALAAEFERLGFCLTPLARHAGGRTGNRNAMLRQGYIELLSVVDGGASATLDGFLARHAGIHLLALAIDDPAAALARLHRAGFAEAAQSDTERAVDDADPDGAHARFTLLSTADAPEARIHLIRHHTPEALWQDRFLRHPNRVVALESAVIAAADPAATAAHLSRLAGRPVVADPSGGYALALAHGRVRMLPAAHLAAVFGCAVPAGPPRIAGIQLCTDDATAALRQWLRDRGVPCHDAGDSLVLLAGGTLLQFR